MSSETVVKLPSSNKVEILPGYTKWVNAKNGFTIADIEYWADPEKRTEEWKITEQAGMPKARWDREYGSSWIVYDGKPVYQDFKEQVHVARGSIVAMKKSRLISGWDAGPNDVNLAWVLGVMLPYLPAITIIDEYQAEDGDIHSFVEIVVSRLRMEWAQLGGFSIHVVDQSVFTKSGVAQGRAVADIMRKYGLFPIAGEISFSKRRQCVEEMLVKNVAWDSSGIPVPRLRVHERCSLLREAMLGGYHYPKNLGSLGDTYKPLPLKNKFSHISNAMEYAASRVSALDYHIPFEGKKLPAMNRI